MQTTAKPYTDAATHKVEELVQKIEGTAPTSATTSDPTATRDLNAPAGTATTGQTAAEKAQGVFAQVSSAVTVGPASCHVTQLKEHAHSRVRSTR